MARERATNISLLLEAAAQVISQKGYKNSTIDDIALAARVSRPTVYNYISNKQDLLDLMVERIISQLNPQLKRIRVSQVPPLERLRSTLLVHIESADENRLLYMIVLNEEPELSLKSKRRFRMWSKQVTNALRGLLDECVAANGDEPATLNTLATAHLVLSMITSLFRWYNAEGELTYEDLSTQILLLLGSAIAPPERPGAERHLSLTRDVR